MVSNHHQRSYTDSDSRLVPDSEHLPYDPQDMISADESDVVSVVPPKTRSGNTFTVKKVVL